MNNEKHVREIKSILESAKELDGGKKGDNYAMIINEIRQLRGISKNLYESQIIEIRSLLS